MAPKKQPAAERKATEKKKDKVIEDKTFGFHVPTSCPGVPDQMMIPKNSWKDGASYEKTSAHLAELFKKNFKKFQDGASKEICEAGPK